MFVRFLLFVPLLWKHIMFANPVDQVGVGRPLTSLHFTFLSYWRNEREQNMEEEVVHTVLLPRAQTRMKV